MRYSAVIVASLFLPTHTLARTAGQLCQGTAAKANDGNWYCSEVRAITYRNISQPGTYNKTTVIDPNTGLCSHERVSYSGRGPLTPFFGELSMHLRGPMNVSQFAVYTMTRTVSRRSNQPDAHSGSDDPKPENHYKPLDEWDEVQNVSLGPRTDKTETARYITDCDVECSLSSAQSTVKLPLEDGTLPLPSSHPSQAPCNCRTPTPTLGTDHPVTDSAYTQSPAQPSVPSTLVTMVRQETTTPAPPREVNAAAVDWRRVAFYTSTAPAEATGFAFLANLGDERKSGTFDYAFGNSLSYVETDGTKAIVAPENSPFDGVLETSEIEIAAFTNKPCGQECEYWRPKSISYHGWGGEDKAFFIQFQMDHYDNIGTDQGMLSDAPAFWFLNAAIPRILQYGNDRNNIPCSCWSTGCGEFDAFEVLGRGEERAKSTIHRQGNLQGGDSNYFRRPVGRMLKFAVVFHNFNITAVVLNDDFDFSQTLSEAAIANLIAYDPNSNSHSLFAIGN